MPILEPMSVEIKGEKDRSERREQRDKWHPGQEGNGSCRMVTGTLMVFSNVELTDVCLRVELKREHTTSVR